MSNLNKKGSTSWYVISMILAILALAIFALIIYAFPWSETSNRELCHESVLLKATMPDYLLVSPKDAISVRCKSKKICVTSKSFGKGECTTLQGDYTTMRVSGNDNEVKEKIQMFLAREMADCWNMMGQGNLEIFTREKSWTIDAFSQGVICSRIEFDKEFLRKYDDMSKNFTGLSRYMITHKVPENNVSYMDYLMSGADGVASEAYFGNILNPSKEGNIANHGDQIDSIDLSTPKVIFYVEATKSRAEQMWSSTGVGIAGGAIGYGIGAGIIALTGWTGVGAVVGVAVITVTGVIVGGNTGSKLDGYMLNGRKSIPAIFLTDYSYEGLRKYNIDSFENVG